MITTIEVDVSFRRHRKTLRLERALGRDAGRWLPIYLWLYAVECARDGNLSHLTDEDLAAVLDYQGDAAQLRAALVAAEFLTADGRVVGWERYTRRFAFYEARARAAASKRWATKRSSPSGESPDLTVPDLNKHRQASSKDASRMPEAPLPFGSADFAAAWDEFVRHRSEIRKPLKPTSAKAALRDLAVMGEHRAIAALRHTVSKGWQGIREPDTSRTVTTRPRAEL